MCTVSDSNLYLPKLAIPVFGDDDMRQVMKEYQLRITLTEFASPSTIRWVDVLWSMLNLESSVLVYFSEDA